MSRGNVSENRNRVSYNKIQEFRFINDKLLLNDLNHSLTRKLVDFQKQSWELYKELSFPSTSDEAWRRTDIKLLNTSELLLPQKNGKINQSNKLLSPLFVTLNKKKNAGHVLSSSILESDIYLDEDLKKQGVVFTDLKNAQKYNPDILETLIGQIVKPNESKFAALTSAYARDGILVYVPRNVKIEKPLHSIFAGIGKGVANLSHIFIWLEEGASLTYIHEYTSDEYVNDQSLHSGIVEIKLEKNANLNFFELQTWGKHVWNFTHERVKIERDAKFDWVYCATGSRLTKSFIDMDLIGEGAVAEMSGLYFTENNQHLDYDTQQNHLKPNTTSDLLFKGVLNGKSRSVWQGMIYVAQGAQKSDGYQANRNITLSSQARADSIPGLEILADDVRCTHASTIGKIDVDHIFYLQSRGINFSNAVRLIVEGFFDPILQRIPYKRINKKLRDAIAQKLEL